MMSYLEEFKVQINNRNLSKFLQLWEEYCHGDTVDTEELIDLLKMIKVSDFAKSFGQLIETALPLLELIQDPVAKYEVLRLLIDLETTNTPLLAELALAALKGKYENQPEYNERIRLIGLRSLENFQGAISNYDLLSHMHKGKFVYHAGGWGTGEIVDLSPIRQQVTIEFELVAGRKHLTFENAFKSIIPLTDEHFLARRFANADDLEKQARERPVEVIKILLKDLGPKTAGEIKDELCELVIPEKDWVKWWQATRSKLKKDPIIEPPEALKDPFKLRKKEVSQEERLHTAITHQFGVEELIQTSYNFIRDLPSSRTSEELRNTVREKLVAQLSNEEITLSQKLQILLLLEGHFDYRTDGEKACDIILSCPNIDDVINGIDIVALKKRVLVLIRENKKEWVEIFIRLLFTIRQSMLREYLLKELNQGAGAIQLKAKLKELLTNPEQAPECFVWFFQKIMEKDEVSLPYNDKDGQCLIFESFLILFSRIETKPEYRELVKKMYNLLSGKRFAIVRNVLEGSTIDFAKEFLLLVSKCQTLTDHDNKILHSLAEVVHPSLAKVKQNNKSHHFDSQVVWTTEEGFLKTQEQIKHIGTVEVIENAREIEAARSLGDLRENSEYKFALEKRSRLQSQLKTLSDQLSHARIITKEDIYAEEVGIGSIVEVMDTKGNKSEYTILGPWDANSNLNILSFQSKLAQTMVGARVGDKFQYRDDELTITGVKSYFDR